MSWLTLDEVTELLDLPPETFLELAIDRHIRSQGGLWCWTDVLELQYDLEQYHRKCFDGL